MFQETEENQFTEEDTGMPVGLPDLNKASISIK